MDTGLVVTTSATVLLAFLGYAATYLNNLRLAQRAERLGRVNRQLAELYGPMFGLASASSLAWSAFRAANRPQTHAFFGEGEPPTQDELENWRVWMTTVFMPVNIRIRDLIFSKADLLVESQMPKSLLVFCAHVSAYQAIIHKWENNDYSEHAAPIGYPAELLDYARLSFESLKRNQQLLLGRSAPKHQ